MQNLVLFVGWMLAILIGLFGLAIFYNILVGKIDLTFLISETNGQASTARFQFLIFTFVIGASLFLVILTNYSFPDIPGGILALLGISGGSYAVGKGISAGTDKDDGKKPKAGGQGNAQAGGV